MEGNIVSAAKTFGICLIISTLILVVGTHYSTTQNFKRLGSALQNAGSNARTNVSIPGKIILSHQSMGPLQLELSPSNQELRLGPVKVQLAMPGQ